MRGEVQQVSWKEIKDTVKAVNPELTKIIDKINPDDDFVLYRISYSFGATILDKGLFYVPAENGNIVPLDHPAVNKKMQKDLMYKKRGPMATLPVGIVLKNSHELFIKNGSNILPVITSSPGAILSLWRELDAIPSFHPSNIFSATAGARSTFMLPNIGDSFLHNALIRKYGFSTQKKPPKELLDEWEIFRLISDAEKSDWRTEILFIPEKWLEITKSNPAWHELYLFFLKKAWDSSAFERNQILYQFLAFAQAEEDIKPNPYLLDTARHLLAIALGGTAGFAPAVDESMAPIKLLQEVYVKSYGLRKYAPVILQPAHFDFRNKNSSPVYYSFQVPTAISFSPRSKQATSTLLDLKELKEIMNIFTDQLSKKQSLLSNTIVGVIPKIEFSYFHTKTDPRDGIRSSARIVEEDPNFSKVLCKKASPKFAYNGAFIRGCIRIGHPAK